MLKPVIDEGPCGVLQQSSRRATIIGNTLWCVRNDRGPPQPRDESKNLSSGRERVHRHLPMSFAVCDRYRAPKLKNVVNAGDESCREASWTSSEKIDVKLTCVEHCCGSFSYVSCIN